MAKNDSEDPEATGDAEVDPVLAANLELLFDGKGIGALRTEFKKRAEIRIGQGTLAQARAGQTGTRLASLRKIAAFYDVTVEQLLQPDLGRGNAEWPFSAELYERVERLGKTQRENVEKALAASLALVESATPQMGESARDSLKGQSTSNNPKPVKSATWERKGQPPR